MNFRRYLTILAVFLLAVLVVQPVLAATNVTDVISQISASNKTTLINQTEELQKDNGTIFYNYGTQSLNLGDFENAIMYFDQALAENTTMLKKTDALLYLYQNKAYVLIQLERYNDAVTTVNEGLSHYPKDPMLWNNKGYALYRLGKLQDALNAYDTSISYDGNYTKAYINRGDVLSRMGRYSEAVAAYTRADETDPGNEAAAEGLTVARRGEAGSTLTMTIVMVISLIAVIGVVVWYVKFRKPAKPAPEEKKTKSKKK
jgi:tetratricopeptide (TPR) repeat protein